MIFMMKRVGKKIICILMMLSMLGGVSIQTVASDVGETTEDLVTQSEGKDLREDENVLPQEEQIEDDDNAISQDIISEEKDNEVGNGQEITEEQRLNYIYVESPYLETPNTQNLVVSWGNGDENIAELSLLYQKDGGAIQEWKSSSTEGNLYLFSQEFISEESTGSYKILSIKLAGNGVEEYSLESLNAVAEFGVNVEYQGYNPKESIIDDKNLETSVVTIDENGNTEGQDSIIEALEEVGVNNKSTFSSKSRANNNIIVALDPGHDERDAGASYNGLREEDLTLKIANYCKVELEEYAGVTVYMTRQSNACPVGVAAGKNHAGPCIRKRVQNAANAGAKIFVSFHLNAATNSAAKGAEVIIPNSSWKYEQYVQGRELAEKILTELEALGLQKRSVYYKNSSNGETYADGNIADYFAVQNAGKQYGIPGLIVEHAFISNVGGIDQSLLNSEEGLKKLGVADATAIAKYFGVSKGYWETDANGKKYYYENNQKVYGEKAIAGKWYHFDESTGAMTIGWYDYPGKRVCYAETGEMLYGEQAIDGKWYYFNGVTGAMVTGWHEFAGKTVYYDKKTGEMLYGEQTIDGKTYYFDTLTGGVYTGWREKDGRKVYSFGKKGLAQGEQAIGGKWYCFEEKTGYMVTGFYELPGKRVCYAETGEMLYGEQAIDGKWYYFNGVTGAMVTGWHEFAGKTVYYDKKTGEMLYGEQAIDGKTYYFDTLTGGVYTGWREKDGRKVYSFGKKGLAQGEQAIGGKWYCFEEKTGYMVTGFYELPGKRVCYAETGEMLYGEQAIDGKWYYFNGVTGAMVTGWHEFAGKTVYYDKKTGEMLYGEQTIDGKTYYFDTLTGGVYTGWREKDGRKVYSFGKKGLAQGEQAIGGKWYCFEEKTGYMVTGFYELPGKRVCYAETGEMLYGEQAIDGKWYYFNGVTGAMVTGWHEFAGKTVYYDKKTGEMLYGEQTIDGKTYYFDTLTGGMKRDAWINGMYYGNDGCQVDYNATYYKIEGATNTNVEQMVRFYNNNSRIPYPADKLASGGASSLKEFAEIYYEEASKEGIRVEVAWAQTMLETGYLKFEGQVSIEQFNFAGLGATDGGSRGADFSVYGNNGVRMGIRAQIQHLKAYSSPLIRVDTLKEQCVDPRFALVTPKGCAPYVEWLGQQENPSKKGWATSKNYGYDILNLILKLLQS